MSHPGGRPEVTSDWNWRHRYCIALPMVDIHAIGAGGGSLIRAAHGGMTVGPESAGSTPGPVCYGRGGTEPTVTDADLVLGRLDPASFWNGRLELDVQKASGRFLPSAQGIRMRPRRPRWRLSTSLMPTWPTRCDESFLWPGPTRGISISSPSGVWGQCMRPGSVRFSGCNASWYPGRLLPSRHSDFSPLTT